MYVSRSMRLSERAICSRGRCSHLHHGRVRSIASLCSLSLFVILEPRVTPHQHDCHETDGGGTRGRTKCKVRELSRASVAARARARARARTTRDLREFYIPRHDRHDPSFTRVRLTKVSSPIGGNLAASPYPGAAPKLSRRTPLFFLSLHSRTRDSTPLPLGTTAPSLSLSRFPQKPSRRNVRACITLSRARARATSSRRRIRKSRTGKQHRDGPW